MDSTEKIPDASFLKNVFFRAFAISLAIHLCLFGGWKLGQTRGWWKESHMPKWLQLMQKTLLTQIARKLPPPQPPKPTPLLFVDVDPAMAMAEPPKEAKFYGAANSQAATTVQKKESDLPTIQGTQEKVIKTTDTSKSTPKPLQPSPPKEVEQTPKPQSESKPKPAETPGDLALAKPQPQPQPEAGDSPQPQRRKKKTVSEAKAETLRGEKMTHEGGATRLAMNSSLDVKRTAIGDYDRELVDAVQQAWDKLLEGRTAHPGKVVLEFHLHYDGRVTDVKVDENEVGDLLSLLCQKAVLDPSPFKRWPTEMRREIGSDDRHVVFTFYYQ